MPEANASCGPVAQREFLVRLRGWESVEGLELEGWSPDRAEQHFRAVLDRSGLVKADVPVGCTVRFRVRDQVMRRVSKLIAVPAESPNEDAPPQVLAFDLPPPPPLGEGTIKLTTVTLKVLVLDQLPADFDGRLRFVLDRQMPNSDNSWWGEIGPDGCTATVPLDTPLNVYTSQGSLLMMGPYFVPSLTDDEEQPPLMLRRGG
jgi:hypothetical protein